MTNKYLTIYNQLIEQIKSGKIPPQTLLPSENELSDQYQTSRETIRKALNLLSQNGYIQKVRGKGSIVIDVSKFDFPVSGLVSFKELSGKMANKPNTIVNQLELIKPDSFIRQQLQLSGKDQVWKIVRTREIGGEKIILDKDYLNYKYVPSLTEEICSDSIYQYLENELNLAISFAKKEIVVQEPSTEDRELLDLEGFHNVVVIKSHVYLDDASLFQYTESRHRPDKFRFVDFARRPQR
ncbi:trehalose operon repressor [Neobacillus sedimentimangrovi]|jgi:GntR family transcriptional regulator, trehalose operon transcriptional repressor|uniref:Trehalose operon repressor n=1 Tax=Neobacillus sedimentimangrovi TaxID=2699460 RepID=A0ABS8QEM2_9BACI|nr:trehalose operon repressor [Neobacillus sedimentimangrovi]AIM15021.1 trehalose operon transcriptional repressor [Bacillus sp. X1(2014)]MCD4837626.1 trehalose operon repressor [Neobacillus sedimentimangrovi]